MTTDDTIIHLLGHTMYQCFPSVIQMYQLQIILIRICNMLLLYIYIYR